MVTALPTTKEKPRTPSQRESYGTPLLRAKGIEVSFEGNKVLRNVDLQLCEGECVLLTGENGSGKTSLVNILTGNLEPSAGEITYCIGGQNRTFHFPRNWFQKLNPWSHFRPEFVSQAGVGRSWQDVRLFGSLSLRDNLEVAARNGKSESPLAGLFFQSSDSNNSERILTDLGLGDRQDSSADMISLGQSKRVAIARAIEAGARILFLDEPLSGLDRQGIDDVLAYLQRLIERDQITFVIVEHVFNQHHLLPMVTTRWVLKHGVCETQSVQETESRITVASTSKREAWLDALADEGTEVTNEVLTRDAILTRIRPAENTETSHAALRIDNLIVNLGQRTVIGVDDDGQAAPFSLTIRSGEIAVLQAPNGWGKSTLFNVITGTVQPTSGSVVIGNEENGSGSAACVPSSGALFPSLTLREAAFVAKSALPKRFEKSQHRRCATLSGGERQRLTLGLATSKMLNVFDEPLNGLDDWHDFVSSCRELAFQQRRAVLIFVPKK